jgi:DNA polymerase-3 subunit beta
MLLDILKTFEDVPLTFDVNQSNYNIEIASGKGQYHLAGMDAATYPTMPVAESTNKVVMSGSALVNAINKTVFATSNDEMHQQMSGIYCEMTPDGVTFVATDAHKLVRYRRKDVSSDASTNFILPKKPADTLKNILPKETGDITMKFDDKNAHFTLSNYEMICRLVEGQYPNYEAIIPNNNPNRLTINRLDFLTTLKRVSVFANQASNLVKLELQSDHVVVSAQDIDFSISAYEKVSAQYDGESMNIGFKSAFLIQILTAITSENIVLQMSDPSRSGIIVPLERESEDEDELMLLMPMMIND